MVARVRVELTSRPLRAEYSAIELAGKINLRSHYRINLVRHLGLEPRRRVRAWDFESHMSAIPSAARNWSETRELNPHPNVGNVLYYRYTSSAKLVASAGFQPAFLA